jgi:hypothetical protein
LYGGKTLQTLRIYRNLISIYFSGNLDPGIFFLIGKRQGKQACFVPSRKLILSWCTQKLWKKEIDLRRPQKPESEEYKLKVGLII